MTEDEKPPENFDYGEKKDDGQYENYPTIDEGEFEQEPRRKYVHNECGTTTVMSPELAKSVARNPSYYIKTFCAGCNEHVSVEEVTWKKDGENWRINE